MEGFDEYQEGQIIGAFLTDEKYCANYLTYVTPNLFSERFRSVIGAIRDYWKQYGKTIPSEILVHEVVIREGAGLTDVKKKLLTETLAKCYSDANAKEYVKNKLEDFIRNTRVKNALVDGLNRFVDCKNNKRNFSSEINEIVNNINTSASDVVTPEPEYALAGIEERTENRKKIVSGEILKEVVPTGITKLDKVLPYNGLELGQIAIAIGPTGRGKSIFLLFMAYIAAAMGFDVLFVTLELSNEINFVRFDSLMTEMPVSQIVAEAGVVRNKFIEEIKNPRFGKEWGEIVFSDMSIGAKQVRDIENELIKLSRNKNFRPKLLVVDYLDRLKPEKSSREGGWKDQQSVSEELRSLGGKYGAAVWTASQANRGAGSKVEDGEFIDVDSVAESYLKQAPADLVVTINQTKSEKNSASNEKSLALHIAKNRTGPTSTIYIRSDFSRMAFYIGDDEPKEDLILTSGTYEKKTKKKT